MNGTGAAAQTVVATAAALAAEPALPSPTALRELVEEAFAAERADPVALRPRDSGGLPGGLLLLPGRPTVLVPDIHARPLLLSKVLSWKGPGDSPFDSSLAELLAQGRATLVCLGDVFHSEWGQAADRWGRAYLEYTRDWSSHRWMDTEMALTLSAVSIVLQAKALFGSAFHYLKGNHDNVSNDSERGDSPFYKFASEGEMVSSWFDLVYGPDLRRRFRELELEYPVLVIGDRFVASHGEPAFAMDRQDVIDYRHRADVVHGLIWTPNGEAEPGSVEQGLDLLLAPAEGEPNRPGSALWFGGHRPVDGRFALRAGGRFVQFHDPSSHQVALLLPGRTPDPRRDIHLLSS